MRKICAFLASVLLVTTLAMSFGPVQTAQAFSEAEVDVTKFNHYVSSQEGHYYSYVRTCRWKAEWGYDLTGWRVAFCPISNPTLEGALYTFEVSARFQDDMARLYANVRIPSGILEGQYYQIVFDAEGQEIIKLSYTDYQEGALKDPYLEYNAEGNKLIGMSSLANEMFVNKTLIDNYEFYLINDDDYVYACVYSESPAVTAETYPTLYAADKGTAVTAYADHTTTLSKYGKQVHWYKLKVLDKAAFEMTDGVEMDDGQKKLYHTSLFLKMGTPVVVPCVSGGDIIVGNDGGVGLALCDDDGFGLTRVVDAAAWVEINETLYPNEKWEKIEHPFAVTDNTGSDETGEDSEEDETGKDSEEDEDENLEFVSATINGASVEVSVHGIKGSDNSTVQASVEKLIAWVEQVQGDQSALVKALNQYAPSMKVGRVLAGGTLDLELEEDVNISSGASITFSNEEIAEQVASGDKILLLHVKHDGTIEYIPAAAENGAITGTFTSLSPVAWFKVEAGGNSGLISPKTGFGFWDFLVKLFR